MEQFLPYSKITGIGSLPHLNADEAVRFVAEYSGEIPFWAQLPQKSAGEMMVPQMLSPLRDLLIQHNSATFEIQSVLLKNFRERLLYAQALLDKETASGFYAFLQACDSGLFPKAIALKGQITGPITLAHCLISNNKALAMSAEIYEELIDYLYRLGIWQIEHLRKFTKPILLFIDEPALELGISSPHLLTGLQKMISLLQKEGVYVGIHCCSSSNVTSHLCKLKPNIISFDAHLHLESFLLTPEVHAYIEEGGMLAFGIIPTLDNLNHFVENEAFSRWASLIGLEKIEKFVKQSMFTATCGLGLLDVQRAEESFVKTRHFSELALKTLDSV